MSDAVSVRKHVDLYVFRDQRNRLACDPIMLRSVAMLAVWCVATLLALGCVSTDLVANNCQINGRPCEDPTLGSGGQSGRERFDTLDLLFVVDNTSSMAATQTALAEELPDMIRVLTSGDVDADGLSEFDPVTDMHFAVISGDMGAPGITGLADCGDDTGRPLGDDGLFLNQSAGGFVLGRACEMLPSFLAFDVGVTSDPSELFRQAGCLGVVGTEGCRHTMPLEAALKALWNRADLGMQFMNGSGHGLGAQRDFLRANALLGIIVITDDDDCSSIDVTHLTPADQLLPDDPLAKFERSERCVRAPDHVHPLVRYENGFGLLKGGQLRPLFFGVIAGVPTDLAASVNSGRSPALREAAYRMLLDDARMQQVLDPASPSGAREYKKVCRDAVPPRRLVALAQRLEEHASVGSICDNLVIPMSEMTRSLARLIDPTTAL